MQRKISQMFSSLFGKPNPVKPNQKVKTVKEEAQDDFQVRNSWLLRTLEKVNFIKCFFFSEILRMDQRDDSLSHSSLSSLLLYNYHINFDDSSTNNNVGREKRRRKHWGDFDQVDKVAIQTEKRLDNDRFSCVLFREKKDRQRSPRLDLENIIFRSPRIIPSTLQPDPFNEDAFEVDF